MMEMESIKNSYADITLNNAFKEHERIDKLVELVDCYVTRYARMTILNIELEEALAKIAALGNGRSIMSIESRYAQEALKKYRAGL